VTRPSNQALGDLRLGFVRVDQVDFALRDLTHPSLSLGSPKQLSPWIGPGGLAFFRGAGQAFGSNLPSRSSCGGTGSWVSSKRSTAQPGGGSIELLSKILGHSGVAVIQHYAHMWTCSRSRLLPP